MKRSRWTRIALIFSPGVAAAIGFLVWGFVLAPRLHQVPQWQGKWSEPTQPPGAYKSWRIEDGRIVGETEPWPHKHPRANSFLLSNSTYEGDVQVDATVRFQRGRYLGCYLCYDPKTDSGYWLSTGHDVGNYPGEAYIKIVHNGDWKTMARAPLTINSNETCKITYRRRGAELAVLASGQPIVTWSDSTYRQGHVQLRLHNTKVEILDLAVSTPTGNQAEDRTD